LELGLLRVGQLQVLLDGLVVHEGHLAAPAAAEAEPTRAAAASAGPTRAAAGTPGLLGPHERDPGHQRDGHPEGDGVPTNSGHLPTSSELRSWGTVTKEGLLRPMILRTPLI